MNCIIIDHDTAAAELLAAHIARVQGLHLSGIFNDVLSAAASLAMQKTDLIFIETELPGMSGMDFIRSIQPGQNIIITASSAAHTLEAFELGVTDYLLKPYLFERFLKAIYKVKHNLPAVDLKSFSENNPEYFFVKSENKFEKINSNDILYIEGLQNYITIQTATKKVITYSSLKSIEKYLCEKEFLRVQKSFIVSISKIDRIDSDDVVIGKTSIPISRAIRENVLKTILNNRLYKYQC